ncbi:PucR family transcriptional regulator [Arthrobacter sp. MYb227]|uniref:PucR family transcriptional regulator n=1 Tax=Arthrobacter sp. MYb227 TaxID=1848601 RepID=UPI000CFAF7F3|nr:helix-turn-helix domain-containing protein [Arthrobacter sp. MYb227]PQZ95178.1 PucR family transcriptional regulator [Arthrobacter sp. MYb227]
MDAHSSDFSDPAHELGTARLAECLEFMQADLVHVNPTQQNLQALVSDVLMYDPLDEWINVEGRIILAVGMTYGSADFDQLLHRAANSQAAAVIIKARGTHMEQLRAAAMSNGVAVLVAPRDADWTRLVALARASVMGASADSVSGVRLGDLYAFANAVASITSGATSIVDPLGRVLGYSTLPGQPIDELRRVTTLALQETTPPAFDVDFKAVYAASGALLIPSTDEGVSRIALAVRAGGELLGTIWIIDPGQDKAGAALEALDRMAPLAGLHMLHARSALDFGERRNGDLIRTLIDDPAHASFAAAQLGLDVEQGLAVAALTIARPETGSLDSVREIQRLLHLVTTVSNVQFKTSHSALLGSVIYAIFPSPGFDARALHRRVLQEIGAYAHTISPHPLIAAVGSISHKLERLSESRNEALEALEYLLNREAVAGKRGQRAAPSVALYEDHVIPLNLMKVGKFMAEQGLAVDDDVAAIARYDVKNQTEYIDTLRAFLHSNGNVSRMAANLHVHNNTVRYRITQLTKTFALDLEDPQQRLWLWLRLTTLDLSTRSTLRGMRVREL